MLTITEAAQKLALRYFEGKPIRPVRIILADGCSGQKLSLVEDRVKDTDSVFQFGELTFIIEKELMDLGRPFAIDRTPQGFSIDSRLQTNLNCSGCSKAISCKKRPDRAFIRDAGSLDTDADATQSV